MAIDWQEVRSAENTNRLAISQTYHPCAIKAVTQDTHFSCTQPRPSVSKARLTLLATRSFSSSIPLSAVDLERDDEQVDNEEAGNDPANVTLLQGLMGFRSDTGEAVRED